MDGFLPPVVIEILANAKQFTATKNEILQGTEEIQSAGAATSAKLSALGAKITNFALLGAAGIGAYATKLAFDYNEALDKLALQSNLTKAQVEEVGKVALTVSKETATSATEIIGAYTQTAKAGLSVAQSTDAVRSSAMFAKAENANLSDTLTAALGIYKLHMKGTTDVASTMDIFTNAIKNSKLTAQDLADSFSGKILSGFAAYGVDLKTSTVALAGFAQENLTGMRSTLMLRTGLAALEKPMYTTNGHLTTQANILAKVGINQQAMANEIQKPGGLLLVLNQLNEAWNKNATSSQKAAGIGAFMQQIFGAQAGPAFAGLMTQLPQLNAMLDKMNQTGSTKSAFSQWLSTPSGVIANFTSTLQDLLIPLGQKLLPIFTGAMKGAIALLNNKSFMGNFGMIGTAIVSGMLAGKLAQVGITIATAFGAEIAAGTAVVIGTAIGAAVLAALAIWNLGKGNVTPTEWANASATLQQNKLKGAVDVGALSLNVITGAANKLLSILPGSPAIPKVPIINPTVTSVTGVKNFPGINAQTMPTSAYGTVKVTVTKP